MATTTVTISQVLLNTSETEHLPFVQPLRSLLAHPSSYAAVDNSGSTAGSLLQTARRFVDVLEVSQVSLWNSTCDHAKPRARVSWRSTGGTEPASVFAPICKVPSNAQCLVFMTDGEVYNTASLAAHSNVTAHLPTLLVIFRRTPTADTLVSSCNVSVLMAHFTAARNAAVLVIHEPSFVTSLVSSLWGNDSLTIRVVAAKGLWLDHLNPPPITDSLRLDECPSVSLDAIRALPSVVGTPMRAGTLALNNEFSVDLDQLLLLEDGRSLLNQLTETNLEDITRAYFALGRLSALRNVLNRWLVLCNQDSVAIQAEATSTTDGVIMALLSRLRHATTDTEQSALRAEIQSIMQSGVSTSQEAAGQATQTLRSPRAAIGAALAAMAVLESSGFSATALGRLSNRAARARTINRSEIIDLATLDTAEAPEEQDLITLCDGPVALCLRAMENTDDNTSDFAMDQGLVVGQNDANAVIEPALVALEAADQVESTDSSPLTRRRLSVCLPIVCLANARNRQAVFQRLCLVYMDELALPHVWLIALGSILRALETAAWAAPGTPTGRLLDFFAGQIMEHVVLAEGTRLSPSASLPVNEAFASIYRTDVLVVHSNVIEAAAILRLLRRYGAPAAISNASLIAAMRARVATAIPQAHRAWLFQNQANPWDDQGPTSLAALTTSLYDTRLSASGIHIPIAGTGHLVERLDSLLSPPAFQAITRFATAFGMTTEDLVTSGTSLIVQATLSNITSPHISSTQSVELVRASPLAAPEMNATTAGTVTTREDALGAIQSQLAWARLPIWPLSPFTTPHGPSTLWFYAPDGQVINMTQGFTVYPDEPREEVLYRLTEYVRASRGLLMQRYYAAAASGALVEGTRVAPMHRAMADEFAAGTSVEDVAAFVYAAVQRVSGRTGQSAGNLHSEVLEREGVMLMPSLRDSINAFPNAVANAAAAGGVVSLITRVGMELGEREPDHLGEPPAAVWVPQDDVEVMETLNRVLRERETARVAALRRRRQQQHPVPEPVGTEIRPANIDRAGRHLTRFLRHECTPRPDGYVEMEQVIRVLREGPGGNVTIDNILQIVETDVKGRFSVLQDHDGVLHIRANQGHTVKVDPEQLMTPIEDSCELPVVLHGTYEDAFTNMLTSGGLNRMSRQAIQMAVGLPNDPDVRSGVRRNVDIVIYIDVERAMGVHGIRFYRSENNVICSPGPIPVDCFLRVVRMRDGSLVNIPS
ncbi:UNVERIFIED_CONTAM: hypothetical protein HDU68_004194 [Siphonaria sp. JEL0065]|nr:hypothetical protein HDU68_004194 [Siphonaria sp. JEL0065]